ncbi:hypothetical protein FOA43_004049 [Brettanomyces nanus]|uniref:Vacuolar protein sorting-associated protein 52 n=1 Tax=Eeniella nana TaxID=13502 RepID=A0A875RX30_EENNA|nr:uncharacterized protein FOA43_004049 [Brettanomyces nanus]QPG76657.1 hypothetical protein FOA43_004049 [Brettanomyces nanus]
MRKLQKKLKPEWEIDYLNELSDKPDSGVGEVFKVLRSRTDNYGSLQEMRFLQTVDESLRTADITSKLGNLQRYQDVIKNSRLCLLPLAEYLDRFGSELNKLSQEMEFLQKRSNSLNSDIEDKKLLDAKLTPLINDLVIPPEVIHSVIDSPMDEQWVENLQFIQEKREIYEQYNDSRASMHDLSRLLDLLELKCIERIRNYLILQIKKLRKPAVASQVIQKQLLEVKEVFPFLFKRNKQLATELRQAYCYTIRWYYYQNFVKYLYSLEKLKINTVDKNVLLGSLDENASNSGATASFFSRSSKGALPEISINEYLINIPRRFEFFIKGDQTAMPAQIAETNNTKYWMESGFKNFNQALIDNVSTEYLFLNEFFEVSSLEEATEFTKLIFTPVYQLGYNYTKYLLRDSYDYFGILILVRMCQALEYEAQHRRVPVLEDYLNYQLIVLWPTFQHLIDENCSSIKKAASSSLLIKTMSKNAMVPLTLTQNFGMVLTNLIRLSSNLMFEIETWEPLTNSVIRLSSEFESCLIKLSGNLQGDKKKELFLYNNFFLILTILSNELEEEENMSEEQSSSKQRLSRQSLSKQSLLEQKSPSSKGANEGPISEELKVRKTLAQTQKDHFLKLVEAYGR